MVGRPGFIRHCQHPEWNPLLNGVYLAGFLWLLKKKKNCVCVCVWCAKEKKKNPVVPPEEM